TTAEEWQAALAGSGSFVVTVDYSDKYGPLGLIAVLRGRVENNTLVFESWVMSCRALARRVEHQTLAAVFARFGAKTARFAFAATPRNKYLQDFFAEFLEKEPAAPFALSREDFHARCPALHHRVTIIGSTDE